MNIKDEAFANISNDGDEQVRHMLGNLPRVSAPSEFDFRLRGRIAKRKLVRISGFRVPAAITYAMGLGVVLIAFGVLGMAWMYSGDPAGTPVVAGLAPAPTVNRDRSEKVEVSVPEIKAVENIVAASKRKEAPALPRSAAVDPKADFAEPVIMRPTVMVPDAALKNARSVYPQGIRPDAGNSSPDANVALGKPIEAKEVISRLGVRAAFGGGGWRVDAVNPGSPAAKGGIRPGDIIETINGDPVWANSSFTDRFSPKNLRVIRGGQAIQISVEK